MKKADVIIVGGSAAGIEAAITARKHHPSKKIVVIREEERALVPCGIPYIMGTLGSAEKNVMPATLLGDAELIVDQVTSIDREA
jgi:NADH oxidase (H2O2-forming)